MRVTEADLNGQTAQDPPGSEPRFVPAAELLASLPPEPEGILGGYIVPANVTVIAGKPKVGKSTLALAAAEAIGSSAASFLGQPVKGGPVLYVSEETGATLAHKIPAGDVHFLTRDLAWPAPTWEELIDLTAREAKRTGAVAAVIDTLAHWSGFEPEREKDAGAMQGAMRPLQGLARDGIGVLLVVHGRKGGGQDGEGLRGSGALAGAADIILELERVGEHPRQRALLALSRYPSTPGALVLDHDPAGGGWAVIGESAERGDTRAIADRQAILGALSGKPEGLTRAELEDIIGAPALQWRPVLTTLETGGQVERSGAGVKGDPYRFRMLCRNAVQAPAQKRTESPPAAASYSGALPVREHQKEAGDAPSANGVRCTASDAELQTWLRSLDAMPEAQAEAEWQRREGEAT